MPEMREIHFDTIYLLIFLSWALVYSPECLLVLGLWADLTNDDVKAVEQRERLLLNHARNCDDKVHCQASLNKWILELKKLADHIPDTHGLLIDVVRV